MLVSCIIRQCSLFHFIICFLPLRDDVVHIYFVYFYPPTLSALLHDCLPTLEASTRSRISSRFMAPGHETPRARRGGVPRAGGRSPRPSDDACAEPLRLEGFPEPRGIPSSGAGPSHNGTCSGGGTGRKIRVGRRAVIYSPFGRTRVCLTPVRLHRVGEWVLSGQNRGKQSCHGASQSGTCLRGGVGSNILAGNRLGQARDRALIAAITAGREPRQAVVSQAYVWVELRQHIFSSGRHAFFCLFTFTGRCVLLLIRSISSHFKLPLSSENSRNN